MRPEERFSARGYLDSILEHWPLLPTRHKPGRGWVRATREPLNLTQTDLAQALGGRHPTVSDVEQPGRDIRLSSLKRYVEASGGKLPLDIDLPDGSHFGFQV